MFKISGTLLKASVLGIIIIGCEGWKFDKLGSNFSSLLTKCHNAVFSKKQNPIDERVEINL